MDGRSGYWSTRTPGLKSYFADRRSTLPRGMAILLLVSLLMPCGGCRLCCDSEDVAYPAYGGAWQRTRRDSGRVGSIFDPAGGRTAVLVSRDEPEGIDSIDRKRQAASDDESDDEKTDKSTDKDSSTDDEMSELERRADELKSLELEDIDTTPGAAAPPNWN